MVQPACGGTSISSVWTATGGGPSRSRRPASCAPRAAVVVGGGGAVVEDVVDVLVVGVGRLDLPDLVVDLFLFLFGFSGLNWIILEIQQPLFLYIYI